MDYGAEAVAIALVLAAEAGLGVRFEGQIPNDEEQAVIAAATGLPSQLGYPTLEIPAFSKFDLHRGRLNRETAHKSSERDRTSDQFARYIDACLKRYGFGLTLEGVGAVLGLLGEVIGNAENHSGRDEWWIGGYLRQTRDDYGDCHVTIFNFGETIYQTMQKLPSESMLRGHIEDLARRHVKRGLFGTAFREEELWTLYAIQGGASRFQESAIELDTDRGQGLADMVTFFQQLGETNEAEAEPVMCLISGHTYIRFDRAYPMQEEMTEAGELRRIIAFNAENNLHSPPDARNVKRLKSFFPGTAISLRFYLDQSHLRQLTESSAAP